MITLSRTNNENNIESTFDQDKFMEEGHGGDLSFMTQEDYDKIHEIYNEDGVPLAELGWYYLPEDIKKIIFDAKVRSLGETVRPIQYDTKVKDGKCAYCKSELIELEVTGMGYDCHNSNFRKCVFENNVCKNCGYALARRMDCSLAHSDILKGYSRKENCQSVKNMMGVDVNIHRDELEKSENKITYKTSIGTMHSNYLQQLTNDDLNKIKRHVNYILKANNDKGYKVAIPVGMEYTSYTVETRNMYEAKINKKDGKVLEDSKVRVCLASLKNYLKTIPKGFKVVRIDDIGFGGGESQGCGCGRHVRSDGTFLPNNRMDVDSDSNYAHNNFVDDVWEVQGDNDWELCLQELAKIQYVQITFQRIDAEIDERILGVLHQRRMIEGKVRHVRAYEVENYLVSDGSGMLGRNNKAFIVARLKKLYKDGLIEMDIEQKDTRQGKWNDDSETVWTASTRNTYRAKNEFANYVPCHSISSRNVLDIDKAWELKQNYYQTGVGRKYRLVNDSKIIKRPRKVTNQDGSTWITIDELSRITHVEMQFWNFIERNEEPEKNGHIKCRVPQGFNSFCYKTPITEGTNDFSNLVDVPDMPIIPTVSECKHPSCKVIKVIGTEKKYKMRKCTMTYNERGESVMNVFKRQLQNCRILYHGEFGSEIRKSDYTTGFKTLAEWAKEGKDWCE